MICRTAPRRLCLLPVGTVLVGLATAQPARQPQNVLEDSWQVVFVQGQRVGYAHSFAWETGTGDQKRIWSESLTRMSVARFGGQLTMTVTQVIEEDADGNLLSFKLDTNNPPISHTVVTGTVDGDKLHLTTTAAGQTTRSVRAWDADVKSPVYQDRLLREDPVAIGETRTLRVFDPQFLKAGDVTITGLEPLETQLLDGSTARLERTEIAHSLVPGLKLTTYQNGDGETLKSETNLLGMVTYTVSREEAVREIAGAQLDLALDTMVEVEPISHPHERRRLVYEIAVDPPHRLVTVPEGESQSVEVIDEQTARVTVVAADPAATSPTAAPAQEEPPVDAACRGSSRYLEREHPQVIAHAAAAAGELDDPAQIALAMEKYVYEKLSEKNFSTALATAAEVATSLEGDCTEHAMLLAAMLRVRDIPSRVAVGLVYSARHSAFVGHMWTEAFLQGRWVPLDATLARGGIGAAHIKFSDSSLSDEGPSPVTVFVPLVGTVDRLKIRVVDGGGE